VRETVRESTKLVVMFMLLFTALCQLAPAFMVGAFSAAPDVIAAGVDYMKTVSWGYVASGSVFVCAGVFQGLGNTWPSLVASALRALAFVVPTLVMSASGHFSMHSIWLVSLGSVLFQFLLQQLLLRRELGIKAPFVAKPAAVLGTPG
jgi:Na+-driven multidrug efflux pump